MRCSFWDTELIFDILFVPDLGVNAIKETNSSLDAIFCADTLSAALR